MRSLLFLALVFCQSLSYAEENATEYAIQEKFSIKLRFTPSAAENYLSLGKGWGEFRAQVENGTSKESIMMQTFREHILRKEGVQFRVRANTNEHLSGSPLKLELRLRTLEDLIEHCEKSLLTPESRWMQMKAVAERCLKDIGFCEIQVRSLKSKIDESKFTPTTRSSQYHIGQELQSVLIRRPDTGETIDLQFYFR